MVDLGGRDVGGEERAPDRVSPHVDCYACPCRVARGEALEAAILLEGQCQVPTPHPDGAVQLFEAVDVEVLLAPQRAEGGQQRLLIDEVRRQRLRHGEDARAGGASSPHRVESRITHGAYSRTRAPTSQACASANADSHTRQESCETGPECQ